MPSPGEQRRQSSTTAYEPNSSVSRRFPLDQGNDGREGPGECVRPKSATLQADSVSQEPSFLPHQSIVCGRVRPQPYWLTARSKAVCEKSEPEVREGIRHQATGFSKKTCCLMPVT